MLPREIKEKIKVDCKTRENGERSKSYNTWRNIINRCYDPKNVSYKYYGLKGVVVCDEWFVFSNFKKWFDKNYSECKVVDKDIKGNGMIYSAETCCFVTQKQNSIERSSRMSYSYLRERTGDKHVMYGKRGLLSPISKNKEYFSSNAVFRCSFKKTCIRNNWNFNNFEEKEVCFHVDKNGKRSRKYVYIEIENRGEKDGSQ
ncbi:MAG: hypothetical protein RSB50_06155 [Cetobacterium sp.]